LCGESLGRCLFVRNEICVVRGVWFIYEEVESGLKLNFNFLFLAFLIEEAKNWTKCVELSSVAG